MVLPHALYWSLPNDLPPWPPRADHETVSETRGRIQDGRIVLSPVQHQSAWPQVRPDYGRVELVTTIVDDIREWGRENGWEVDGDRLPRGLRAAYDARDSGETTPLFDETAERAFVEYPGAELPVPDDGLEEIPPVIREEPLASKARSFVDRVKRAAPAKTRTPRGRKPLKARVSVDKLIALAWRGLAQATAPINLPVARVLDMQAPVAGAILEDTVKGTVVDRLLQPLARVNEGGEAVFALLGPPLLVGVITSKPEIAPMLVPLLKESLRRWIDIAGPRMEELAKKEEDFAAKYGTRIDDMIEMFLAPPPGQSE